MGRYIILSMFQKSNGYWYVRERVPVDVQKIIGKKYFERSLKTKNKAEAAARAAVVRVELDKLVTEARLKLAPKRNDSLKLKPVDLFTLAEMCIRYQVELMEEADSIVDYINYLHRLTPNMTPTKKAADGLLLDFFHARNIAISPRSKAFEGVSKALLDKWDMLTDALVFRGGDKWGHELGTTLTEANLSEAGRALVDNSITITALYEEYRATELVQATPSQKPALLKRFRDIDQVVRWFVGHVGGDIPVQQVTKQHASTFVNRLILRPVTKRRDIKALSLEDQIAWAEKGDEQRVASNTVKKDVRLFQSLFSVAVDHHYIEENPFTGSLKRVARKAAKSSPKKTGYSDADLQKVFGSDLFRHKFEPVRRVDTDYGLSLFWVPLICHYTGARLNEVAQLHLSDVKQEEGVWCIDINPNADDKRTKNGEPRLVPIHEHLLDLGFLEYVEQGRLQHRKHKTATSHRVFSMLKPNTDGTLSAGLSRMLGTQFKALGIAEGLQPVHAFRHTFKTACRRLNVAEDVHDAITGHQGSSVGRGYGGIGIDTANKVIQQLERVQLPVKHYTELK
ncbi:site-specific integrase [Microbulbifer sp. Q7]|uniref:site-specific integrase n=1 Tax=Microbulbifer sp. Q7 TaxID=1785091 RepID=UPI000B24F8FC|nr:site-specific integrase [Microbulbifer sp. Q7]